MSTFNFSSLQEKANQVIHNADEITRKFGNAVYGSNPVDFQVYDRNGNLVTRTVETIKMQQQKVDSYIAGARGEYPFVNILANSYMLDTNGDGVLDSPLIGYADGDYSIVEKKVYAWNDSTLPSIVTQAFYDTGIVYNDSNGNPTVSHHVPFNVQKFVFSGTDYNSGHALLMGLNPVKGKYSFGALAVVTTTGHIKIEGIGDLQPDVVYKYVVFRNGVDRNFHIDVPVVNVQGQADIWVIGPWVVPGTFADSPGVDKGHPLFLDPNGSYIVK